MIFGTKYTDFYLHRKDSQRYYYGNNIYDWKLRNILNNEPYDNI